MSPALHESGLPHPLLSSALSLQRIRMIGSEQI